MVLFFYIDILTEFWEIQINCWILQGERFWNIICYNKCEGTTIDEWVVTDSPRLKNKKQTNKQNKNREREREREK